MAIDERLDRLTGVAEPLAGWVSAGHLWIKALVKLAQKNQQEMVDLVREWQAQLRTPNSAEAVSFYFVAQSRFAVQYLRSWR